MIFFFNSDLLQIFDCILSLREWNQNQEMWKAGFQYERDWPRLPNIKSYERFNETKAEAYSEPSQTSKMELFAKLVNSCQPVTIFAKIPTLEA